MEKNIIMEEVKNKNKFSLPEQVVVVKYIKRNKGMAADVGADHVISGGMLNGAKRSFVAPLLRNGSIANVLNSEEKALIEDLTGLDLSVYGDFWKDHYVSLIKDDNRLDLSQPMDYISYKILLNLKDDIAPTWSDRNKKQTYQFVMTSENDEMIERKKGLDTKKEAFKLYNKIEDDREKLIGIFRLLSSKSISENSKLDWIQGKVEEFLDADPKKFVDLLTDASLDTRLLLTNAVSLGIVSKNGDKYSTAEGLDLAEGGDVPTFVNAIKYLDNPKHQDVRDYIEAKISNVK